MSTVRLTVAQALVRFLASQSAERDGAEQRLIPGLLRHLRARQRGGRRPGAARGARDRAPRTCRTTWPATSRRMVHAVGRLRPDAEPAAGAWPAPRSIGPGSTNMVTGAALATINRIPVLLLPSDFFATRVGQPGAAGARGPAVLRRERSTTRSSRCRGSGTGSTGPSSCRRRCWPRCGCSPTRPRPAR